MAKIIKWADEEKMEILIEEDKKETRIVRLDNLHRDLKNAIKIVKELEAQIKEIEETLEVKPFVMEEL